MILLDTSILSLAFRHRARGPEPAPVAQLRRMIGDDLPLALPAIVFQELLSGVRTTEQFDALEESLAGFPLVLATREHHRMAAKVFNDCRRQGITVGAIDALIAAQAIALASRLFTLDEDFSRIASACDLTIVGLERDNE